MTTLDRYLFREMLRAFLVVLFIAATLLLIGRVFDRLGDILESRGVATLPIVVQYFLLSMPFELAQVMPFVTMIAVLWCAGGLARNREIIAMLCGGVSVWRIAAPFVAFGLLVGGGLLVLGEFVVPAAERQARRIELVYIRGKLPPDRNSRLVASDTGGWSMYIETYSVRHDAAAASDADAEEMREVTLWRVDPQTWRLAERLDASKGSLVASTVARTTWEFEGATRHGFAGDAAMTAWMPYQEPTDLDLGRNLNLYLRKRQKPEEMNFRELSEYVDVLSSRGDKVGAFETDLHLKIAFPLGVALLVVIGFCAGLKVQFMSPMVAVSQGILLAVVYFFLTAFLQAFGHADIGLPPLFFAWATDAVYAVVALAMVRGAGRAR